jgi:hypothetical protein
VEELAREPEPAIVTADEYVEPEKKPLPVKIYGFAMADAIYDFKRVNPNWEDTLRVSTIPTTSGTYGNDGNFTFGVRQSRLDTGDLGNRLSRY